MEERGNVVRALWRSMYGKEKSLYTFGFLGQRRKGFSFFFLREKFMPLSLFSFSRKIKRLHIVQEESRPDFVPPSFLPKRSKDCQV